MTPHRRLLQQVRHLGRYTSDEEAERVLHAVLAALGSQLTGDERHDLAAALPGRARTTFASQIPLPEPVPALCITSLSAYQPAIRHRALTRRLTS